MCLGVTECLRFAFVSGIEKNIPDPVFVGLVASKLKSGQFWLYYGMVLFCIFVGSFVSERLRRDVGISSLSLSLA